MPAPGRAVSGSGSAPPCRSCQSHRMAEAPNPIRVLLVDDQDLVRSGFAVILDAEPDITVIGEAADGAQAIDAAVGLAPDVVVMDIRMPGVDGLAATASVRART